MSEYEELKNKIVEIFVDGSPLCCAFITDEDKTQILKRHLNPIELLDAIKSKLIRQDEIIKQLEFDKDALRRLFADL